jgi:hypothetical protein
MDEVTRKDAHPLLRVDDTLDEFYDANLYKDLDLAYDFSGKFESGRKMSTRRHFKLPMD